MKRVRVVAEDIEDKSELNQTKRYSQVSVVEGNWSGHVHLTGKNRSKEAEIVSLGRR